MPIVDLAPTKFDSALGRPEGFAVTPGEAEINRTPELIGPKQSWLESTSISDALSAAFRQDNTVGSFLTQNRVTGQDDGLNPWESIKGTKYEPHFASFADVRDQRSLDNIKRQIDQETADKKLLEAAPWYESLPAQLIAGAVDLPTLIPGGAFVRGAKGGFSIARSATNVGVAAGVGAAAQEAALQGMQETRTAGESAVNIGGAVLLGGLLGAGGAKLLSNAEWTAGVAKLERTLEAGASDFERGMASPASAGAAANTATSIEDNSIAGAMAGGVAAATARLNPALRALHSPSAVYREEALKLFENAVYLKKNDEGIASEAAVETFMKGWNAGLAKAVGSTDEAFRGYTKAGGAMKAADFREAVGKAMRRGDEDADPFVSKVAKEWRANVFDPLKEEAIKAGLLPKDVSVETAQSYFSRMWNKNKLTAQEPRFKSIVQDWINNEMPKWQIAFDRETADAAAKLRDDKLTNYLAERRIERESRFDTQNSGRQIADEVFNSLVGRTSEGVRPDFITIKARGPLKERTFNIPDHLVEDFLEHDVTEVGRRYTRIMGADVELSRKFGSVDLKDQIGKIREDYDKLRSLAKTEKERLALSKREKDDIGDLEAMRDMLRGTDPSNGRVEQNFGRIIRSVNHVNYLRSMGEVALASLSETVRPAMVHGLMPYMQTIGHLATNLKGIKASVAEAKLAGNIVDGVLGHRLATLADIADPYASRGPIEAFLENMTNIASKWNGIGMLTDMQKSISSVMSQDRILKTASAYGKAKAEDKRFLAYVGIDQSMAERIAAQFAEHGDDVQGVKVANTEKWTDDVARRTYRAAINKDVDSIITTKGVADTPLFANTPTGRAMLQFKSFALASHQRVLLRGLQESQTRFLGGLIAMSTIGMMTTWLKAVSGNRTEKLQDIGKNPGWWVSEGIDRAGILSVPMELANTFEKATTFNPIKTPLKAFDEGQALSQRMQNRSLMGSIAGPSAGLVDDFSSTLGIPNQLYKGEALTKGQKNAAERLLPFNSYFGVRQLLRYVVNPQ